MSAVSVFSFVILTLDIQITETMKGKFSNLFCKEIFEYSEENTSLRDQISDG